MDIPSLTTDDVTGMISQCLTHEKYEEFIATGDMDAAADIPGCGRFRINAFRQSRGATLVLRIINAATPEIAELCLPQSIGRILELKRDLSL